MQITEVYYETIIPIAPYINKKIGATVTLSKNETADEAFAKLVKTVDEWGQKLIENRPSGIAQTFDAPVQIKDNARWDSPPYGTGDPVAAELEFQELKQQLDAFPTEKDATLYLLTTPFKFSVEAKNYIKQKFAQP